MEVTSFPLSTLPPAIGSTTTPTSRASPRKTPISPKRSVKSKRASPKSGTICPKDSSTAKATPKTPRIPAAGKSPLVPVTERRPNDDRKASKDTDTEKWEIAPDGTSASREGRQFTVSNVGNNGRIYLRPTVRPAHQRYPQPEFIFPVTPPGTASLGALGQDEQIDEGDSELRYRQWTPTPRLSPPLGKKRYFPDARPLSPSTRHRRALSDSTIREATAAKENDSGVFKIIISKPGDELRPKTTEDMNPEAMLDVNIPTWRIGIPRFTSTGTPLIRGSSYAPTEVSGSILNGSQRDLHHSLPKLGSRRPSTVRVPQARLSRAAQLRSARIACGKPAHPLRLTYTSSRLAIEPAMYDSLTFKPFRDDRSIVRYAPSTGAVTAATPPRLVAEITSPSFLDYELISDFFLTFRAFLEPTDLLRMLVARFRWAVARNDETGMIVHVRAFVALRHWILNYFMDDFLVDYGLRVHFCNSINAFDEELSQDGQDCKVQLKILNELKKCWRRVCAHYWDGPDFEDTTQNNIPIAPGGIAGHRDPSLDPTIWDKEDRCPQLDSLCPLQDVAGSSFYADVSRAGHVGHSIVPEDRPITPDAKADDGTEKDLGPASPNSMASMDVVSCSFPSKQLRCMQPIFGQSLAAHPVASSSVYNQTGPVATTPKDLIGKRVRPTQLHQRNDSLPDSLREASPDKVSYKDQEFLMTTPFAGSLVRGNVLPPGQAFVDVAPLSYGKKGQRQTTIFQPQDFRHEGPADAMSGRGMKRLIGSVRRALSTRGQGVSPTQGGLMSSFDGPGGATTNRLPGTAIVPQNTVTRDGTRPPVRIDLLGAEVAEDFKRAVREDAAAEAEKWGLAVEPPKSAPIGATDVEYSAAHMDSSTFDSLPQNQPVRPASDTGLTVGSKSIVIVDDTVPLEAPTPPHIFPADNPSVEAFFDSLIPNGGNLTPPITPPTRFDEVARRSSLLFNEHIRSPFARESLPPFIPDLDTLKGRSSTLPSEIGLQSLSASHHSHRFPPVSATPRAHRRNRSSRTQRSLNSTAHHRNASFSSDLAAPSMTQSFDATTYTRCSILDDEPESEPEPSLPKPSRILRRRPGGDLRAATNVGELDPHIVRRSLSLGSLSVYTESVQSSRFRSMRRKSVEKAESIISGNNQRGSQLFSVGQLADKPKQREMSLCSIHSSKPVMRPSFEAEAKRLAQIPDDDDDGGVESALLKLEGRFDKRPSMLSMSLKDSTSSSRTERAYTENVCVAIDDPDVELQRHKKLRKRQFSARDVTSIPDADVENTTEAAESVGNSLEVPPLSTTKSLSFLSDDSGESYSSIPLLDRGLTDDGHSRRAPRDWAGLSMLQDSDDEGSPRATIKDLYVDRSNTHRSLSYELVQKTESIKKMQSGGTVPSKHEDLSFLDSDLSSELSDDDMETRGYEKPIVLSPRALLTPHPLDNPEEAYPSPPTTIARPMDATFMEARSASTRSVHHDLSIKPLPITPEPTPALTVGPRSPYDLVGTSKAPLNQPNHGNEGTRKYSVHLPFILAFDSETLAQQFTLIEKDALNEIDWKELVDMDWKNAANNDSRSWVDFLRNTDAHGVEVVIARFNIVVKWAISEVVLTQHIEERAKCIIKYIHIASHCRRYRNFATLAQLTIALSSTEVSRLAQTWELVPPSDMKTLRELEALVTPTRNFYNLRGEMESGPDTRCIPFVGIYTHDLLYNAQRPSEIASSPTTEPLVNFERCRIGASVVKTLLRLLEASTRYNFRPIEGITERCLWIGALSDEEIRRYSGNLE